MLSSLSTSSSLRNSWLVFPATTATGNSRNSTKSPAWIRSTSCLGSGARPTHRFTVSCRLGVLAPLDGIFLVGLSFGPSPQRRLTLRGLDSRLPPVLNPHNIQWSYTIICLPFPARKCTLPGDVNVLGQLPLLWVSLRPHLCPGWGSRYPRQIPTIFSVIAGPTLWVLCSWPSFLPSITPNTSLPSLSMRPILPLTTMQ